MLIDRAFGTFWDAQNATNQAKSTVDLAIYALKVTLSKSE